MPDCVQSAITDQYQTVERTKRLFILAHSVARQRAMEAVEDAPEGFIVTIDPPKRTLEQNAAQWPILDAIAAQLKWPVNGELVYMTQEEWKDVLTAAFRQEQPRLAKGVSGGVVMLGQRTSKFKKSEFSEWLDFLHWFCAEKDIEL